VRGKQRGLIMWEMSGWIAWGLSAIIFLWLAYDFFVVNKQFDENVLLSSREGVDELFPSDKDGKGAK
jgi:hypothetical protein